MPEPLKTKPQWIRDTGLIAVALPPPPALRKYAGGQGADFDAGYEASFSDAALDSLVRAGVTLAYAWCYAGFGIEFEKNETERLRDYIARAHTRGIKVGALVALGAATPETLLIEEHDAQNWLQFNGDGRTIVPDSHARPFHEAGRLRPAPALTSARPCYNAESYLRYLERVCGVAVDYGADLIYFVAVGYSAEPDACRCPICVGLFREFLRQQYGIQDDKTRRLGKERFGHNSFTHTRPAAYTHATVSSGEPLDAPHEQEWVKFKTHTLAQCIARLSRAIFKRNPQCAVGADVLAANPAAESAHAIGAAALLPHLDLAGPAHADMLEAEPIAPDAPPALWSAGILPASAGIDPRASYQAQDADELAASEPLGAEYERLAPQIASAIRNFKVARAFGVACECALDLAALETSLALQLAFNGKGLGVAGAALSPWFAPGWEHRVESDAALGLLRAHLNFYARYKPTLLLDTRTLANLAVLRDSVSLAFDPGEAALQVEFENLLIEHNIPYDLVFPQQLDDLSKYRGLILAGCAALSDETARKAERFAAAGGGLLALGAAGQFDEWRRPRPQAVLAGMLGEGHPQALQKAYGSGRVAYLPAFCAEQFEALHAALEFTAGGALPLAVQCASSRALAEAVLTRGGAVAVHLINPQASPAKCVRIALQCERPPAQVVAHRPFASEAEREHPVQFAWDNGLVNFELPELTAYTLVELRA